MPDRATERRILPGKELTDREVQALNYVARGYSNKEIGREMLITELTAKSHLSRLFIKLHARDRAHAVALGFQYGILKLTPMAFGVPPMRSASTGENGANKTEPMSESE